METAEAAQLRREPESEGLGCEPNQGVSEITQGKQVPQEMSMENQDSYGIRVSETIREENLSLSEGMEDYVCSSSDESDYECSEDDALKELETAAGRNIDIVDIDC